MGEAAVERANAAHRAVEMNLVMRGNVRVVAILVAISGVLLHDLSLVLPVGACALLAVHLSEVFATTPDRLVWWARAFFCTAYAVTFASSVVTGGIVSPVIFFCTAIGLVSSAYFPDQRVWQLAPAAVTVALLGVDVLDGGWPADAELSLIIALLVNGSLPKHGADLVKIERDYRQSATVDPLTSCLNRRSLPMRIGEIEHRVANDGVPVGVIALDIDHFKEFNDRLGHAAGDRRLRTFADAVRSALRRNELFFRMGGEEFVVLLPGVTNARILELAEAVRVAVERSEEGERSITASVGVAWDPAPSSVTTLIHSADLALYEAKSTGRNAVVCARG